MQFKRQQLDTRDKIGHELARYQGKVALITGASSGIGKAFARELARRGMDLILVARSEQRLQQISTELTVLYGIQASVIAADLSQPDAVQKIKATVDARGLAVHLLVNNAGFGVRERFEKIDPVRDHEQVMVNVAAVVDLTHAFLPGMLARNEGAVINLGALAGFQPVGYFAVHAASKAFIHAFSQALWAEYRQRGINVLALCPGPVDTNFFTIAGGARSGVGVKAAPDRIVTVALKALEQNKIVVAPGLYLSTWFMSQIGNRLFSRAFMARYVAQLYQPENKAVPGLDEENTHRLATRSPEGLLGRRQGNKAA